MGHKTYIFFPNGKFDQYISRKYPTYFACVFWYDLECNLSDIYVGYFLYISRTNYNLKKHKKHGSQNRFFQTACGAPFRKKQVCLTYFARAFLFDLDYNLSDI